MMIQAPVWLLLLCSPVYHEFTTPERAWPNGAHNMAEMDFLFPGFEQIGSSRLIVPRQNGVNRCRSLYNGHVMCKTSKKAVPPLGPESCRFERRLYVGDREHHSNRAPVGQVSSPADFLDGRVFGICRAFFLMRWPPYSSVRRWY